MEIFNYLAESVEAVTSQNRSLENLYNNLLAKEGEEDVYKLAKMEERVEI